MDFATPPSGHSVALCRTGPPRSAADIDLHAAGADRYYMFAVGNDMIAVWYLLIVHLLVAVVRVRGGLELVRMLFDNTQGFIFIIDVLF